MKTRFSGLDVRVACKEITASAAIGLRVQQVYDVDAKTYLIRLQKPDLKVVLLVESGCRLHTTSFEWPKRPAPSGFAMKLRKHINNKRLERVSQIGSDRIVDMQFGSELAAYHLIAELYDRGNLVLTDHNYQILHLLRPRVQGEDRFLAREIYPIESVLESADNQMNAERLSEIFARAQPNDTLKKLLTPHFEFGPALLEHLLLDHGLRGNLKVGKDLTEPEVHFSKLLEIFQSARGFVDNIKPGGVILRKKENRPVPGSSAGDTTELFTYTEFHPLLLRQHAESAQLAETALTDFGSFDAAVDEFFSKLESQKIELKTLHFEKQAMKKLENVEKDHKQRIEKLQQDQVKDRRKAELIEMNEDLVNEALRVMRSALANQLDWKEISELVDVAKTEGDPVASRITGLKLESNHFTMLLKDPYSFEDDDSDEENNDEDPDPVPNELSVDIDIDLSAQANARRFYVQKKTAAHKLEKTAASHNVALKSAEKRTKETLKEAAAITNIIKARKVFWFEKFFWFISSENYLVIAGRDMQQNEVLVKRYLKAGDLYVHADLHGASSVVIKNPAGGPVPPKTLNEAGQMAVCYSAAWDSKVVAAAWWVESSQVSKTAPTGEYLTAGSFMIRGKKNFLLPSPLILGFGFLFKLEEGSMERHKNERRVRTLDEEDPLERKYSVDQASDSIDEKLSLKDDEDADLDPIKEEEDTEDHDEDDDGSSSASEHQSAFPDTTVDVALSSQGKVEVLARGMSQEPQQTEEQIITFVSKTKKSTQHQQGKKSKGKKGHEEPDREADSGNNKDNGQKRGKKGKMKKIKGKYRDQDEEEKEMRMELLQGKKKANKKAAKPDDQGEAKEPVKTKPSANAPAAKKPAEESTVDLNDDDDDERVSEVDMLSSLTGQPVTEDELLFAVPVVAPYPTLVNYKFKVKLTPGTGKRGKATKTALNVFLNDKTTSQRDKDLLKSVKDQDLARNLPGKVKLNITQQQKAKKKK